MSSTIEVTVPTDPMANSVHEVTHHIDGATAAIVVMQTATIAAEQLAARRVCENVDRGFHALIRSQISQKSAKAKSVLDSRLQEMIHFHGALRRVKAQMERDFHRIAGRYHKLFNTLNEALKSRVLELDNQAATLAGVQMPVMIRRMMTTAVQTPIQEKEILPPSQGIAAAIAKKNVFHALRAMQGILDKSRVLQLTLRKMTDPAPAAGKTHVYLPLVAIEADDLNLAIIVRQLHLPGEGQAGLSKLQAGVVECAVKESFDTLGWAPARAYETEAIRQICLQRLNQSGLPARVKERTAELLSKSKWQGPGGARQ